MKNFALYRFAGRIARQLCGADREPVAQSPLHLAEFLIAVWAALFGSCFTALVLVAFFGDRILNIICRG